MTQPKETCAKCGNRAWKNSLDAGISICITCGTEQRLGVNPSTQHEGPFVLIIKSEPEDLEDLYRTISLVKGLTTAQTLVNAGVSTPQMAGKMAAGDVVLIEPLFQLVDEYGITPVQLDKLMRASVKKARSKQSQVNTKKARKQHGPS